MPATLVAGAECAAAADAVRVLDASSVLPTFHARFDARGKTYRYRDLERPTCSSPFERAYAWHVPAPRSTSRRWTAAARLLEGRHDFAAFQAAGAATCDDRARGVLVAR